MDERSAHTNLNSILGVHLPRESVCRWVCLGNVHFYNTRYRIAPHGFLCLPRAHPRQCVVPEWTQAAGGRQKPPLRPLGQPLWRPLTSPPNRSQAASLKPWPKPPRCIDVPR